MLGEVKSCKAGSLICKIDSGPGHFFEGIKEHGLPRENTRAQPCDYLETTKRHYRYAGDGLSLQQFEARV